MFVVANAGAKVQELSNARTAWNSYCTEVFCRTVPVHNCPDGIPWHGANRLYHLPMKRAARSAIMIVGAFVLPLTIVGITEASATRNPTMSWTLRSGLTTASESVPMRQVHVG